MAEPQPAGTPKSSHSAGWLARVLESLLAAAGSAQNVLIYFGVVGLLVVITIGGFLVKPNTVECEGIEMSPGDTCRKYREPGHEFVESKSYSEMMDDVQQGNLWVGRIGLVLIVLTLVWGLTFLIGAIRKGP